MSTHPSINYELAVTHHRHLVARADVDRATIAGRTAVAPRTALSSLGSLLIAAGERLGGIRTTPPSDLAGAAS